MLEPSKCPLKSPFSLSSSNSKCIVLFLVGLLFIGPDICDIQYIMDYPLAIRFPPLLPLFPAIGR